MQKFRPSYKMPFGSLILMLLAAILGGVIIGGVVAVADQFVYLVFLFPLLMGALGGGLIGGIVRVGKVRNPVMALFFGFLTACVIYGAYQFGSYYLDHQKIINQLVS